MPVSAIGLVIVLALVPGYVYLRLAGDIHQPQEKASAVAEILEVATAGIVTTGATVVVVALAMPTYISRALAAIRRPLAEVESHDIRLLAISALVLVVASIGFALLLSIVMRKLGTAARIGDI